MQIGRREICQLCASEEFLVHGFSNRLSPVQLSFVWTRLAPGTLQGKELRNPVEWILICRIRSFTLLLSECDLCF